jgi:hypothetical protein
LDANIQAISEKLWMIRQMDEPIDNPFSVTRAADFTDEQIDQYWVDLADGGGGFLELIKPRSAMPMLILGGKGSGKTHIMRYLSFRVPTEGGTL